MLLTSGFLTSALGTVTVSTPFSSAALTSSVLAFSGRRKRRTNWPLLRSTRCHLSPLSSFSLLRCPLMSSTLPSSTSTFTSSFFTPGRSALNTCASGVSFQSMRALAKAAVSEAAAADDDDGTMERNTLSKGSKRSTENGSNTLPRLTSDISAWLLAARCGRVCQLRSSESCGLEDFGARCLLLL
uniref:Uncharacterized protein n=1 Tax=Zea mays TaxID=4577 RepID=C0P7Q6_MAIZE|nr:unknown [Zea mays]ACR36591.1 unknown [Zea mays]